jgi:hypothetical protein
VESIQRNNLRWWIGAGALAIILIHVCISLYVLLVPEKKLSHNKIVTIYKQLFILGPFFAESRIKSSHHLSVRYKSQGHWSSSREFVHENFLFFSRHPWRLDRLPYNDYEKRLGYLVSKLAQHQTFEQVKKSSAFRELNSFILQEYVGQPADSINVLYGWQEYNTTKRSHTLNTVFNYTYNPGNIDKAKK